MVGRLVEQQRLRVAEQRLREQDADLLSALQLRHRALVQLLGDVEPLQQHGRVALGGVAVLLADDALELAETHAVVVRHVGLRVEALALLERRPEPGVAHDDGVDARGSWSNANWSCRRTPSFSGADDRALLRRELAGQQLHERGLAGAVRARSGRSAGPAENVVVTSSKRTFDPYRIETLETEIICVVTIRIKRSQRTTYSSKFSGSWPLAEGAEDTEEGTHGDAGGAETHGGAARLTAGTRAAPRAEALRASASPCALLRPSVSSALSTTRTPRSAAATRPPRTRASEARRPVAAVGARPTGRSGSRSG